MRHAAWAALAGLAVACGGPSETADGPLLALEEARYVLRVDASEAASERTLRTLVTGREPYHFSVDYPVRFELEGAAVGAARTIRGDAAARLDEDVLEFEVALGARDATNGRVVGTLHFAVCKADELCEPVVESFEATLR